MKRFFAVLLATLLVMSTMIPVAAEVPADAYDISQGSISIDGNMVTQGDGDPQEDDSIVITGTSTTNTITIAGTANVTLNGVNITATGASAIVITGTVNMTLVGNNSATSTSRGYAGVQVNAGAALTIGGEGTLNATGGTAAAGIGSAENSDAGTITINGGTINAVSGSSGAGIGGSNNGDGGVITITGGTVTATGSGKNGAGIGGGLYGKSGNINITGGTVTATGGEMGPGIGSGYQTYYRRPLNENDKITITGANTVVNATGGNGKSGGGAGIGSGAYGIVPPIEITNGATVTATSTAYGAGVGGGSSSSDNIITISGAKVTATGGSCDSIYANTSTETPNLGGGAGIGSGADRITGTGFTITITDSTVEAIGGSGTDNFGGGAGIGGGSGYFIGNDFANGGNITITDSIVEATGGSSDEENRGAAGIGGGGVSGDNVGGYSGNIAISGGTIEAIGGNDASGIGGGGKGGVGITDTDGATLPATITISNSALTVIGGEATGDGAPAPALGAGTDGSDVEGSTISVSCGAYSSDPSEYVPEDTSIVKVTSGDTTLYYVGDDSIDDATETLESGDSLDVIQGDVDLTIPTGGVTVENSGEGEVTVNGDTLPEEGIVTELNEVVAINRAAADKKAEINDITYLTDAQKEALYAQIDEAAANAIESITAADSPEALAAALAAGLGAIAEIEIPAEPRDSFLPFIVTGVTQVKVIDAETEAALEGATFELYRISVTGSRKLHDTYTSNATGRITARTLSPRFTYELVMTAAPEGYDLLEAPVVFKVQYNRPLQQVVPVTKTVVEEAPVETPAEEPAA